MTKKSIQRLNSQINWSEKQDMLSPLFRFPLLCPNTLEYSITTISTVSRLLMPEAHDCYVWYGMPHKRMSPLFLKKKKKLINRC